MEQNKTQVFYFYDALCGWCYGFSPVISKVKAEFESEFDFHIVSGGLKSDQEAGPIGVVAPYIKAGAYKVVEEKCGVIFGEAFIQGPLQEGTMIMNSLPPGIALSIVKELKPELTFEFGSILHRAIYVDGLHPEDIDGYGIYAEKIGLNGPGFIAKMNDPSYKAAAQKDFMWAKRLGITGFPTVLASKGDSTYVLTRGYVPYEVLVAKLRAL